ncbi:MAG TPA: hypothetical protein PLN13_06460 [Bacteroidia bacterium]|nr:hypothetical protein [Bacteroidia bacterium]HRH08206.1 hypothetical protein [Bacteroidia bacterium]
MEEKIFSVILNETKLAYESSSLSNSGWFYSIASTRIFDNCTLLIGLNWGVGKEPHEPQKSMPIKSFDELYSIKGELGSFSRLHGRLKTYLKPEDFNKIVQSNFCFFRTPSDRELLPEHIKLTIPIFNKLINEVRPRQILCFSKIAYNYLISTNYEPLFKKEIKSNKKTLFVEKGYLNRNERVKIYFLPHPNSKFTRPALDEAWDFCFNEFTINKS